MKLNQQSSEFSPIALVLETREEAQTFWDLITRITHVTNRSAEFEMALRISDWLSNEAHL